METVDDTLSELVANAARRDPRSVAKLITLIEDDAPNLPSIMELLAPHSGAAHVIGITGPPGVGKSTATSALVGELRARGDKVAVLAVDPSSPFSGGALLGDRVRMQDHALDPNVYIRSMASRGHLGGLSWAAPHAIRVFEAASCDRVLVETVGVGQSEFEVATMTDTTIVQLAPGMGDGIQATKAGLLEVGDIYVVNKADRDGADHVTRDLRAMLTLAQRPDPHWNPPIVKMTATTGQGVDGVVASIEAHRVHLIGSGELANRRNQRARHEIQAIAIGRIRERWEQFGDHPELGSLAQAVASGNRSAHWAADQLLAHLANV